MHFHLGKTHSCHHPELHSIELPEVIKNPNALYNTSHIIKQRRDMLFGNRPSECSYCWKSEDVGGDTYSDRVVKSNPSELRSEINEILNDPFTANRFPKNLEVSFSNACQMKCSYCSSRFSTSWAEELKKFGSYSVKPDEIEIINDENSKLLVEAFWKTLPELKKNLSVLRFTGGEPLLSTETIKVLQSFEKEPAPQIELAINSNLSVSEEVLDRHLDVLEKLIQSKSVKSVTIYTSLDAYEKRAEYIRFGLNHEKFWKNLDRIFKRSPDFNVRIMTAFNILSITSFSQLLSAVREFNLQDRFNESRTIPLYVDIHHLRDPEYQSILVGAVEYKSEVEKIIAEMIKTRESHQKFAAGSTQINSMKRVAALMNNVKSANETAVLKSKFFQFFSEHDRRRGTVFGEVFPEMSDFWNLCKAEYEKQHVS